MSRGYKEPRFNREAHSLKFFYGSRGKAGYKGYYLRVQCKPPIMKNPA